MGLHSERPSPPAPALHSPAEIAQATADIACKQATNLMGTATAVQDAYDRQYIAGHGPALAEYRKELDDRVHAAEQIVAVSGAPPRARACGDQWPDSADRRRTGRAMG